MNGSGRACGHVCSNIMCAHVCVVIFIMCAHVCVAILCVGMCRQSLAAAEKSKGNSVRFKKSLS
jgi:hypothetical protein